MIRYLPGQARARQRLPAGVRLILRLGPQNQLQGLCQREAVLNEHVAEGELAIRRNELQQLGGRQQRRKIVVLQPVTAAPHDALARSQEEAVLEVQIVGVHIVARHSGQGEQDVIVEGLDLQTGATPQVVIPTCHHVLAGDRLVRRRPLGFGAVVEVALQGYQVCGGRPIHAEAALRLVPVVPGIRTARRQVVRIMERIDVRPIVNRLAQLAAILGAAALFEIARADIQRDARSVGRFAGHDVDDTVDRVRAPECRAGAADHFDALDIFRQDILHVPRHARMIGRIYAAPVDEHQQFGSGGAVETACRHGKGARGELRHLQVRRQAQHVRNAARARSQDIVTGDDVDRGGRIAQRLRGLGDRRDLDLHQVLDAEGLQRADRTVLRLREGAGRMDTGAAAQDARGNEAAPHGSLGPLARATAVYHTRDSRLSLRTWANLGELGELGELGADKVCDHRAECREIPLSLHSVACRTGATAGRNAAHRPPGEPLGLGTHQHEALRIGRTVQQIAQSRDQLARVLALAVRLDRRLVPVVLQDHVALRILIDAVQVVVDIAGLGARDAPLHLGKGLLEGGILTGLDFELHHEGARQGLIGCATRNRGGERSGRGGGLGRGGDSRQ